MSRQHDFEYWLRFTLPKNLNISESKKKAVESVFGHFADYVNGIASQAPEEFDFFFENLKSGMSRVEKWRRPKRNFKKLLQERSKNIRENK